MVQVPLCELPLCEHYVSFDTDTLGLFWHWPWSKTCRGASASMWILCLFWHRQIRYPIDKDQIRSLLTLMNWVSFDTDKLGLFWHWPWSKTCRGASAQPAQCCAPARGSPTAGAGNAGISGITGIVEILKSQRPSTCTIYNFTQLYAYWPPCDKRTGRAYLNPKP